MLYENNEHNLVFQLNKLILISLYYLYRNDAYLIEHKPDKSMAEFNDSKHHVGERSIVFRFAHYLQNEIRKIESFENLYVDCEYNRNIDDLKKLPEPDKRIIPDVIIHERGVNDNNMLVMEFKTYWNNDQGHDEEKIECFTYAKGAYKYKYGVTVLINEYSAVVKGYEKAGVNLPVRKTSKAVGYDIEAVEDVVIPPFKNGILQLNNTKY